VELDWHQGYCEHDNLVPGPTEQYFENFFLSHTTRYRKCYNIQVLPP